MKRLLCFVLVVMAIILASWNFTNSHQPMPPIKTQAIDAVMQKTVRDNLYKTLLSTSSKRATALVLDANTGALKAMVNLVNPDSSICQKSDSCDPAQNIAVAPWEPGSALKPLLIAAALSQKAISVNDTYYDSGYARVKDRGFTNAEFFEPQTMTIQDVLTKSLNTGAIHVLKSLGDGTINQQARSTWYDYLTQRYNFGDSTRSGIPGEAAGEVRLPSGGRHIETQYASMAFGVGLTVTPLQLAAAYAAIVNGGTYYQPHVSITLKPKVLHSHVVSPAVSQTMIKMLEQTLKVNEPAAQRSGYMVGAKTGTAPLSGPDGAYKTNVDSGVYVGFIGKTKPQYILLVRLDEPHVNDFASSVARSSWAAISNQLIDQGEIN